MILIADSGSTKTTWCFLDKKGSRKDFFTEGYNPYYLERDYIINSIRKGLSEDIMFHEIERVFFYGAGCEGSKNEILATSLKILFNSAEIAVASDMLAASKALLGDGTGIACILGTGMNSCLVDNSKIIYQVDSLGFLLGDEGSGAYLGKKLLMYYARKALPQEIMDKFYHLYKIVPAEILDVFHESKLPNRFSASFAPFLKANLFDPAIHEIVRDGFSDFFKNIICKYPDYRNHKLNFVGSIAFNFQDILNQVAKNYHVKIGKIYQSPMDNLCRYHIDKA